MILMEGMLKAWRLTYIAFGQTWLSQVNNYLLSILILHSVHLLFYSRYLRICYLPVRQSICLLIYMKLSKAQWQISENIKWKILLHQFSKWSDLIFLENHPSIFFFTRIGTLLPGTVKKCMKYLIGSRKYQTANRLHFIYLFYHLFSFLWGRGCITFLCFFFSF